MKNLKLQPLLISAARNQVARMARVTLAAMALLVSAASATVSVGVAPSAPANVAQSRTTVSPGALTWYSSRTIIGQSFVASSSYDLTGITLALANTTTASGNFSIGLYQISNTGINPLTGGTSFPQQTGLLNFSSTPNGSFVSFTLDTPVSLVQGTAYAFLLNWSSVSGSVQFQTVTGGPFSDYGHIWAGTGSSVSDSGMGSSLAYYLIPEPSACTFIGVALFLGASLGMKRGRLRALQGA